MDCETCVYSQDIKQLKSEVATLKERYSDNHTDIEVINTKLDSMKSAIEEIKNIVSDQQKKPARDMDILKGALIGGLFSIIGFIVEKFI